MPPFTQEKRLLTVDSTLGKDVLLLSAFSGREELSRLFHYQLDLLSPNDAIPPKDIVGQPITWAVHHVDKEPRFFNGVVSSFCAGGKAGRGLRSYRAEVVPWLWFLTRTANCKIFQSMSADKIIQAIFDDLGFTDYNLSVTRTPVVRDYCVQYRETAFNFVTRLMEEEGIFYFFKHEDGKHTLVLADAKTAYFDCPEKEVEFGGGSQSPNHISAWEHRYEYRVGKVTQTDYNFETPTTSLLTTTSSIVDLPKIGSFEVFDYPGLYAKTGDGTPLTKIRMEEEETPYDVVTGASTCCTFTPAGRFELTRHECEAEMKVYVVTGVQHHGTDPSTQLNGVAAQYSNTFTCIPAAVVFRPARITPKPFVQGPQTAVVVGPAGKEEIFTDKYGRVKVQFHWDRVGKHNADSSFWIRVATAWAGKGWGQINIPRIGHEVIVEFLEGDPDKPIIVGSVYNAENMPAKKLPEGRKTSGLVSRTNESSGGGFNQITCDDTKDNEKIIIHGQYDLESLILHDETWIVKNDVTIKILEGKLKHDVVAGTADYHVQGKLTEKVDNVQETWVALDVFLQSIGGNIRQEAKAGEFYVFANKAVEVKSATDKIHILAETEIMLQVGSSKLLMKKNGEIELSGVHIAISGSKQLNMRGGQVLSHAETVHNISGASCVSEAAGNNTVKGMIVLLNP